METKEQTFNIRFSLSADLPNAVREDEDFDENSWFDEWETSIKPGLIRAVFSHLRSAPHWTAHIRNRGISPREEIEIVVQRKLAIPGTPPRVAQ
jgi:hypothetical protein